MTEFAGQPDLLVDVSTQDEVVSHPVPVDITARSATCGPSVLTWCCDQA